MIKESLKLFARGLLVYVAAVACYFLGSRGQFSVRDFGFLGITLVYGAMSMSYSSASKMLIIQSIEADRKEKQEAYEKRLKKYPNTPAPTEEAYPVASWDKPLCILLNVLLFGGMYFIAGVNCVPDSKMDTLYYLGIAMMMLSLIVRSRSLRVQPFLDPMDPLDIEKVIAMQASGPYSKIRHPAQSAVLMYALAAACCFVSVPSLICAIAIMVVTVIRTQKEDRFLEENLHGFKRFAFDVPQKLLPNIW